MREFGDGVAGLGTSYHQLARHCTTAGMDRQRLFGRQGPLRSETLPKVDGAELPIRGIPGRALALHLVWAAQNDRIRQTNTYCQLQIASGPGGGSEFWQSVDG